MRRRFIPSQVMTWKITVYVVRDRNNSPRRQSVYGEDGERKRSNSVYDDGSCEKSSFKRRFEGVLNLECGRLEEVTRSVC